MIKQKGNIQEAINSLKSNDNNAVAFIYKNPSFGEGVLNNATITFKDLFATKDAPTQGSSKILENFQPHYDATVVKKIREAGAALLAKVHSDELGLGGTGEFSGYGKVHHPLDKTRIIGGSSSGSVATLNENITYSLGTDTGDSVRLPASYNGFVGFKPSYGAISRYGVFAYASSLDTVAMFGHNVNDIIELSKVTYGQDELDMTSKSVEKPEHEIIKPKRVAYLKDELNVLDPAIREKFDETILKLKNDGVEVEEVIVPLELLNNIDIVYSIISFSEASSNDSNLNGVSFGKRKEANNWSDMMFKTRTEGFGHMVQRRFTLGAYFLSVENQEDIFFRAQKVRRLIVDAFNKIYENYDMMIFPSTTVAPLASEGKKDEWYSSFLIAGNLNGNPSLSIPFTKLNGMPVGLNLDAKLYDDKKLLSYALYMEEILGGENE